MAKKKDTALQKLKDKKQKGQASIAKKKEQVEQLVNKAGDTAEKAAKTVNNVANVANNAMSFVRNGAMSVIDAAQGAITVAQKYLDFLKDNGGGCDVMEFIKALLGENMSAEAMTKWLTELVLDIAPELEETIKEALMAEIKAKADCSVDPNIPNYLRKNTIIGNKDVNFYEPNKGVEINVKNIDYRGIFQVSPLSVEGSSAYFGAKCLYRITNNYHVEQPEVYYTYKEASDALQSKGYINGEVKNLSDISTKYELLRARDMNAFMWFAMAHSTYVNKTSTTEGMDGFEEEDMLGKNTYNEEVSLDGTEGQEQKRYNLGDCIQQANIAINSMVIKEDSVKKERTASPWDVFDNIVDDVKGMVESQGIHVDVNAYKDYARTKITDFSSSLFKKSYYMDISSHTVPYSDGYVTYNWYGNENLVNSSLAGEDISGRDYDEDLGIFNLEYRSINPTPISANSMYEDVFLFTILPKPTQHIMDDGTKVSLLFDRHGNMQTRNVSSYTVRTIGSISQDQKYRVFNVNGEVSSAFTLEMKMDGTYELVAEDGTEEEVQSCLFPCYKGLTYLEFCHDYLYGMQILDPMTIAAQLLQILLQGGNGETTDAMIMDSKINMLIEQMIASADGSQAYNELDTPDPTYMSDDDYAKMLADADKKHSEQEMPASVKAIRDCSSQSTRIEKLGAIQESMDDVMSQIDKDSESAKNQEMIQLLLDAFTTTTIKSTLSPKVLMLLELSRKVLSSDDTYGTNSSMSELLVTLKDTISNLSIAIHDKVMSKLIDKVVEVLMEIIKKYAMIIAKEQVEAVKSVIASSLGQVGKMI